MNDKLSNKDKKDWQTFISSKDEILDKDFKPEIKNSLRVRSIDLHGYTLEQANKATEQGFAVGMDASLQINPYYGKTSEDGLFKHFFRY